MTERYANSLARDCIPHLRGAVIASGDNLAAIRTELRAVQSPLMTQNPSEIRLGFATYEINQFPIEPRSS